MHEISIVSAPAPSCVWLEKELQVRRNLADHALRGAAKAFDNGDYTECENHALLYEGATTEIDSLQMQRDSARNEEEFLGRIAASSTRRGKVTISSIAFGNGFKHRRMRIVNLDRFRDDS